MRAGLPAVGACACVMLASPSLLRAQQMGTWVRADGRLSAWGELYGRDGPGGSARPDQTGRVTANLTLDFGGVVQMPLTALISTDQVGFRQEINQVGVSPRYRWVQMHAGYFSPSYSKFTLADNRLLGGGADVDPGALRAGFAVGRSQRATRPDSGFFSDPTYARHVAAGHVGVRDERRGAFEIFAFRSRDDPASLGAFGDSVTATPGLNEVVAAVGELPLAQRRVLFQLEGARSRYLRDVEATAAAVTGSAGSGRLTYNSRTWTLGGTVEWIGAGFATFGNQQLRNDHLDVGLVGRLRLLQGRANVNAQIARRRDNLSEQAKTSTTRGIYSINVDVQPSTLFGTAILLSNNQNRSRDVEADTALVSNVTAVYSATPRFVFGTGKVRHVLVLMGMLQRSDNETGGAYQLADTRATTLLGSWTLTPPGPIGFTATATSTRVDVDTIVTTVLTLTPGATLTASRARVQVTAQVQFTRNRTGSGDPDTEVFPLGELRYRLTRFHSVALRSSVRRHRFATPVAGLSTLTERVVRLEYTATFRR